MQVEKRAAGPLFLLRVIALASQSAATFWDDVLQNVGSPADSKNPTSSLS
jgi:hypothetical protein